MYDVVDGDTIKVRRGSESSSSRASHTVRLIGIDTPETRKPNTGIECGGLQATSHMLSLTFPAPTDTDSDGLVDRENATTGVRVSLDTDRTQDVRDSFGRVLAYVRAESRLPANRTRPYDLGREMLLSGWAAPYVFDDDFRRLDSYEDAASDAEGSDAGVYGACESDFHTPAA